METLGFNLNYDKYKPIIIHWFMNCSPVKTIINSLVKLNHVVLTNPTMPGDQIKLNYMCNNKVDTISEIWFPSKGSHVSP